MDIVWRGFLGSLLAGFMGVAGLVLGKVQRAGAGMTLRPPGALPEAEFLSQCARCFKCANVCPNECIKFHGLEDGLNNMFTPYIKRNIEASTRSATRAVTGAFWMIEVPRSPWSAFHTKRAN